MEIKTEFVQAKFIELYKKQSVKRPTGKTRKNILGFTVEETERQFEEVYVGDSTNIDGHQLASDVDKAVREKLLDGYAVKSITPVTSGTAIVKEGVISSRTGMNGKHLVEVSGTTGISYGFSFTEGMLITFVKE